MKVTFIGLGVMGYPMAGHLVKNGYQVTVFNRTTSKAKNWLDDYADSGEKTPVYEKDVLAACKEADVVVTCVSKDEDVLALTLGYEKLGNEKLGEGKKSDAGVFSVMKPGAVFIDHSTISADASEKIANKAIEKQLKFLDAPVSGGQAGAENGALTVMVGGDKSAYDKVEELMESYAKAVTYMGESGSGQRTKMVNQICIAGLVQALSEGIAFSEKCGLDTKRVLSVISKGAAQSWQMENRGETMVDDKFDFGFAIEHMRKDLSICLNEAKKNGADLTVTQLIDGYYSEVEELGSKRWDTSSLIKRLNR